MNNVENFDAPADLNRAGHNELQEQYSILRKLFEVALFALLIMGLSFNYFILRQMVFTRKDLDVVRPQVTQLVEGYSKSEEPQIRSFVNNLVAFGKTHPDFNPILAKYKIVPDNRAAAAPAPAAAVPAPPARKK